jgi:zinc protease
VAAASSVPRPPALAGEIEVSRLANGLELALVHNPQAPLVTSALFYRAGARDEEPGLGGLAHFLEHLMFKGSERYAPGEIDRRTQTLGGANNAFTNHDLTAYWFTFASDRWSEALAIESDRMRGLRLDAREVEAERRVIVEEIAMYRDEPWDALELDVLAALFPGHPYGRPVLGTPAELGREDAELLASFHRRFYRPGNAVLVVAGDLEQDVPARVEEAFGGLDGGAADRRPVPPPTSPGELERVERRQGEVARLLLALPAPPPDTAEHGALRLLATALAAGRASRLQRELVEEGQLCLSVTASLAENQAGSHFAVAAELVPGTEPREVERRILAALAALAATPIGGEELERARRVFCADWAWSQERIYQQAVATGFALAEFDLDQPRRLLDAALAAEAPELVRLASIWLDPLAGGVLGVSLPEG